MKLNPQRSKWYLFVAIVLAFAAFSFPAESSAKSDSTDSGSPILLIPPLQETPYPPDYPNGEKYDEYINFAKHDVVISTKFLNPITNKEEGGEYKIPAGLKLNGRTNNERCDTNAEAFGMFTFDILSRAAEALTGVPGGQNVTQVGKGIAEAAVMRCQFQDSLVNSAEIQAGYENTKIIIGQLNTALDVQISSRATQKSVDDLQAAINKLDTANLDYALITRDKVEEVTKIISIQLNDATRATQSSLDDLQASVDSLDLSNLSNLDVKVSTLASKDDLSPLATQDNLDSLINLVNVNLDTAISSRASQDSLDALHTAIDSLDAAFVLVLGKLTSDLDVAVSTRASQESLDALQSAVDDTNAAITIVQDKLNSDLDVAVSTRASQVDLDELRSVVDKIASELSKLDVAVSTRASQESVVEVHDQVGVLNDTADRIESKVDALANKADTLETKVDTIQTTLDHCEVGMAIVSGPGGRNYTFYVHTTWHGERMTPSKLTVWVGGDQPQNSSTTVIPGVTSIELSGVNWNDLRNQPLTVEATISGGTCSAVEIIQ